MRIFLDRQTGTGTRIDPRRPIHSDEIVGPAKIKLLREKPDRSNGVWMILDTGVDTAPEGTIDLGDPQETADMNAVLNSQQVRAVAIAANVEESIVEGKKVQQVLRYFLPNFQAHLLNDIEMMWDPETTEIRIGYLVTVDVINERVLALPEQQRTLAQQLDIHAKWLFLRLANPGRIQLLTIRGVL